MHGHLPSLPSGEEPRAHRVMQAEGRRSRGGRSVASDSGGRRDCRAVPKGSVRSRTRKPEDIRPLATTSRARPQGAKGTPKVVPKGRPRRGPEERWSRRLEASRPMRPGRENRGDATGRPTLEIHFRRPLLAFYQGRAPPRARARGGFRAPDIRRGLRSRQGCARQGRKPVMTRSTMCSMRCFISGFAKTSRPKVTESVEALER
jgi:hypothetical protein